MKYPLSSMEGTMATIGALRLFDRPEPAGWSPRAGDRPVELGVAVGEDATVGGVEPVTLTVFGRHDADDGPLENQAPGRAVELRCAEAEDPAIGSVQPVTMTDGRGGSDGRRRGRWGFCAPLGVEGGRGGQGVRRGERGTAARGGKPAVEGVAGVGGCRRQGDGGALEPHVRGHRAAALGVEGDGVGGVRRPLGVEGGRGGQGVRRGERGTAARGGKPAVEGVAGVGGCRRQGDGGALEPHVRGHRAAALGVEGDGVGGVRRPLGVEGGRGGQGVRRGERGTAPRATNQPSKVWPA